MNISFRCFAALLCAVPSINMAIAAPGDLEIGFNPNLNNVPTMALQPDGKIIVGGEFTTVGGASRNYIARLNSDGTMDVGFLPDTNGSVECIAIQNDGKIVIGGYFTSVNGVTRNYLARLNPNGTLDVGFNPNPNGAVVCAALQSDGKMMVAGLFTRIDGSEMLRVARLNPSGTHDTSFWSGANAMVRNIVVQLDGKIIMAGDFTRIGSGGSFFNSSRIVRLNSEGLLDLGFNVDVNDGVLTTTVQPDGKVIIGGFFTTVNGVSRNRMARLAADGTLDPAFNPNANVWVYSTVLQADGKIVIGGGFSSIGGVARNYIARLNANGSLDTDFDPNADGSIISIGVQGDGRIVIGGGFSTVGLTARNCIARLDNDMAPQQIIIPNLNRIEWLRSGTSPEALRVTFEVSTDGGVNWNALGSGTRITGGWGRVGLNLPASGQVRARAHVASGHQNGSSSIVEAVVPYSSVSSLDVWRQFYFGTFANSGNAADTANPDGDGGSNLEEFAFGTDPTVANAGLITVTGGVITQLGGPATRVTNILNSVQFRALYGRRKDYIAAGLTYTVQFSADLATWVSSVATPTVIADDGTIEAVTVPYPFFINGKKARFFRVTISVAP